MVAKLRECFTDKQTDSETDRQTDGWTNGRSDGRTDGQMHGRTEDVLGEEQRDRQTTRMTGKQPELLEILRGLDRRRNKRQNKVLVTFVFNQILFVLARFFPHPFWRAFSFTHFGGLFLRPFWCTYPGSLLARFCTIHVGAPFLHPFWRTYPGSLLAHLSCTAFSGSLKVFTQP